MLRLIVRTLLLITALAGGAMAQEVEERPDLEAVFAEAGVLGTFAMFDVAANRLILVHPDRARTRFIPASTFKIPNSLIALETGVVSGLDEVIPYGGQPQWLAAWEEDMPIGRAFAVSNLPVFQEIARRTGLDLYKASLARLAYGNERVGEDVETFWLKGPLEISAVEQTRFLAALARKALPISDHAQGLVHQIARIEAKGGAVLYGKTGWTTTPNPDIGWFVGWVDRDGEIFAFALNMDMKGRADAPLRPALARQLLDMLGVY